MNEIIEMANQAGCVSYSPPPMRAVEGVSMTFAQLEAFAKLVAAKEQEKFSADLIEYGKAMAAVEREACALIGDGYHDDEANCGDLIRARGEA